MSQRVALGALCALATTLPLVTAYQLPPQPAFFNQWASGLLWSLVFGSLLWLSSSRAFAIARSTSNAARYLLGFWALMFGAILFSALRGASPWFTIVPSLAVVVLAGAVTWALLRCDAKIGRAVLFGVLLGILIAAVINSVVALLQQFAARWYDDVWIAAAHGTRPFGNLRQPNLLALLMLWGLLSAFVLFFQRRIPAALIVLGCAPLLYALWLSGSRAGWLGLSIAAIAIIAYWFDERHRHMCEVSERISQTPLSAKFRKAQIYWAIALFIAVIAIVVFGILTHSESVIRLDAAKQRVRLWQDSVQLIATAPWLGVGFGQLNFAWTLTPLANRSPDVFDHVHNLPLQIAVEFGLPVAIASLALLAAALWLGFRQSKHEARTLLLGFIGIALWQSLFEYPLWFAHFLLPTAVVAALFMHGNRAFVASDRATPQTTRGQRTAAIVVVGVALAFLAWLLHGYLRISQIYANERDHAAAARSATIAQNHFVYGHYGDYAHIMLSNDRAASTWFARTTRSVIDEKLLVAWARALEREGNVEAANYLIARAREFPVHSSFNELPPLTANPASAPFRVHDARSFVRATSSHRNTTDNKK